MKKALISGISGFVGSHLTEYLLSQNINVSGFYHPDHSTKNIDAIKTKIELIACNVLDNKQVNDFFKKNDFDYVFHLAAFSSPSESINAPQETLENNIMGELNILEALSRAKSKARILIVGSAEEYGFRKSKAYIDEETDFDPQTPYAVSKIAQDLLGYQFFLHKSLNIVRVRPFNHIGPRQSGGFVVAAFAKRIASCEKTKNHEMTVGNLDTWRDFTDVRDVVRAYLLALQKGEIGEVYNIGSGKCYRIGDILKILISFSSIKIKVITDKNLQRVESAKKIRCNFEKFHKATGWEPQIPISKTLFDTIKYERSILN